MNRGFTTIEASITAVVILILLGSAFGVIGEMTHFLDTTNTGYAFGLNASTALSKLDVELRKIGTATVDGSKYPFVGNGGESLHFVRLDDPPCDYPNGGDFRWKPREYVVSVEDGQLGIWAAGERHLLCIDVSSVAFELSGRKISVNLVLEKPDGRGGVIRESHSRIIVMRNW